MGGGDPGGVGETQEGWERGLLKGKRLIELFTTLILLTLSLANLSKYTLNTRS